MASERSPTERILEILRPYAANWTGTLGRGDLVIPRRDVPRLIKELLAAAGNEDEDSAEASDTEIFQVITEARRRPSMQDEVAELRRAFVILKR